MNDRDQRRDDRLTRVQTFGRQNAGDFTPTSKAIAHFANIDRHLLDLADAKAGQRPARVSKETLLDALVLDFKNIARTARAIALSEHGFAAPYRIPDNPAESAIATHADALLLLLENNPDPVAEGGDTPAQKATKAALRAKFIAYELPEDFVADLRADREVLREANEHNQGENQEGVEDTARIGQILARAAIDVQELNAIMHNKYARDPAKLRAWQSASHVERAPVREKKPGGPTSPPQAP